MTLLRELFAWLNQGWTGIVVGVLVAYYFYRKTRIVRKLAFQRQSTRLIGERHPELPGTVLVTYNGHAVERLTKSVVVVWNDGTVSVSKEDLVLTDPLRIEVVDGEILQVEEPTVTRTVNGFQVNRLPETQNALAVTFDFLDPGDGFRLEFLHTAATDPKVLGTIRGIPNGLTRYVGDIPRKEPRQWWKRWLTAEWVPAFFFLAVGGFTSAVAFGYFLPTVVLAVFPSFGEPSPPELVAGEFYWGKGSLMAVFSLLAYGLSALGFWAAGDRGRFPKSLVK